MYWARAGMRRLMVRMTRAKCDVQLRADSPAARVIGASLGTSR